MKVYDTNYPPDIFGRIRMGLIKEMYLTHTGFTKPAVGDHVRISCTYQGVVRDVITLKIMSADVSTDTTDTVLIKVNGLKVNITKADFFKKTWF